LLQEEFTDFGFNLWATAEVSENRNDRQLVNRLFGAVMGAKLLLVVFSLVAIWTYAAFSGVLSEHRSVLYWAALPIIGITLQPILICSWVSTVCPKR
jgi:PST family polysaccharide transporter